MSIPGAGNPLLLGGAAGGYEIERSLRFNSADSAYLNRTPASAGNRKTWTWAGWVKRSAIGNNQYIFYTQTGYYHGIGFNSSNEFYFNAATKPSNAYSIRSAALFRDPSAWYHIVVAFDVTQATASNRIKIYVNGSQLTTFAAATYPALNDDGSINSSVAHTIGEAAGVYVTLYLADIHFIDGQALDPTSFGEFDDNGIWQPIEYTGTYGTNGFHLDFADNSTAAALGTDTSGNGNTWTVNNISVLNGNGSYAAASQSGWPSGTPYINAFDGSFTTFAQPANLNVAGVTLASPVSINSTIRVYVTGCTANTTLTINPNTDNFNATSLVNGQTGWVDLTSGVTSGSFDAFTLFRANLTSPTIRAWEIDGAVLVDNSFGFGNDSLVDSPTNYGTDTGAGGEVRGNYATLNPLGTAGAIPTNGNLSVSSSSTVGNRISTFFLTSGKWYWEGSGNGYVGAVILRGGESFTGSISTAGSKAIGYWPTGTIYWDGGLGGPGAPGAYTASDTIGIAVDMDASPCTVKFYKNNVLQSTITSGSGTVPDFSGGIYPGYNVGSGTTSVDFNFGQRPFAYTAPSGFKALCTTNLPDPTITDGSSVMDVKLYTGNGSTQTISGLEFSPDLVWIKGRSGATDHALYDSVRGVEKRLESNTNGTEVTSDGGVTAFNSDGFSLGTLAQVNTNTATYAGWTWDAGSSTVTNTAGTITSQVRANPSAGFSIVTYTGNGVTSTIGHGLGAAPELIIVKKRTVASTWVIYTKTLGRNYYLPFTTGAASILTGYFGSAEPTSTVFGAGGYGAINASGSDYVAYCFAPVAGYSAFGSYTGNGSADGPFVYLGFRPAVVLVKMSSSTGNWTMLDYQREGYNVDNDPLYPNLANAEGTTDLIDITSNGFKVRTTDASFNTNAGTYIYAAFAEHPFALARAR